MKLTIAGKSRVFENASFPWTVDVKTDDPSFPTKSGKYELAIDGVAGCTGHLTYVFACNASDMGVVTDLQMVGWPDPSTAAVCIQGHGQCMLRVATWHAPYHWSDWFPFRVDQHGPSAKARSSSRKSDGLRRRSQRRCA